MGLAAQLPAGSAGWNRAEINRRVQACRTARADFAAPPGVYIVYFTAATDASGAVQADADLYGRDPAIVVALADAEDAGG